MVARWISLGSYRTIVAVIVTLLVSACEFNDSGTNQSTFSNPDEFGQLSPRILASSGELKKVDTVRLRLRLDSSTAKTIYAGADVAWATRSATIGKVPLNRKWFLEVFGTTGSDTLWYGTDTGTLVAAGNVSHSSEAPSVVVKNFVPNPVAYVRGVPVKSGARIILGDTLVFRAPDSASLGIADVGMTPTCSMSDSGTRHIIAGTEGGFGISIVACSEGRWDSRATNFGWSVVSRDSLILPVSGALKDWNKSFEVVSPDGLDVAWRAIVLRETSLPTASDWGALDRKQGFDGQSSIIDSATIQSLARAVLKPNDTAGRVLIKAWLRRGDTLVDSSTFWWIIMIPRVPAPLVEHVSGQGSVRFSWRVSAATRNTKVWNWSNGSWIPVVADKSDSLNSVSFNGLPVNRQVAIRLIAVDSARGRESDTVWDSASSRPADTLGFLGADPTGSWRSWTSSVSLVATDGLPVVWRGMVFRDTGAPTQTDWNSLESKTGIDGSSSIIDSAALKSLIRLSLKPYDTIGKILVKALLRRGDTTVDSIAFWWKVRIPNVPTPAITHVRGHGSVQFSWDVTAATKHTKAWVLGDAGWNLVAPVKTDTTDHVSITGLPPNRKVIVRLVGYDSASGRESDTAFDSATSRNPPQKPVFDVVNIRTDSAYVTLSLLMDSASREGVSWSVAYGTVYSQAMSFSHIANLSSTPWIQQVGEGTIIFAVRAERDDSVLVDTQWCVVKGAASNRPQMPQNLRLARRTTDSLYWQWNSNPDRSYSVYWGKDNQQVLVSTNSQLLSAGTGQFAQKLSSGDSSWIAVFAQPGGDSMAGQSVGAYSNLVRTRLIPAAPLGLRGNIEFDSQWKPSQIALFWNPTSGIQYVVSDSLGKTDTVSVGKSSTTRKVDDTRGLYVFFVRALNADSVLSQPSRISIQTPGVVQVDRTSWVTWISGDSVKFRLLKEVSPVPDSLRILAPWAAISSTRDLAVAFPRVGELRSIAFDSAILRGTPSLDLQYRWSNGDYSPRTSFPLNYQSPTIPTLFDVSSGESGDTVAFGSGQIPSGWSLQYTIHSISRGWETVTGSGLYGMGVDSIRGRLIRVSTTSYTDTMTYIVGRLDHRKYFDVVYRDGTKGTIPSTRISGVTWMAQNLNYDIPNDTFDVCYLYDQVSCATKGRQYSVSQIFSLSGGKTCDTLDWTNSGTTSCNVGTVGICPVGWRLPTSADWESLGRITVGGNPHNYRAGRWPGDATPSVDPFGLGVIWPNWCFRQGGSFGCYDSTIGTVFPASDPGYPGTVSGAYFDVGTANPIFSAMIGYYNPEDVPRATSYFPVRCVKE